MKIMAVCGSGLGSSFMMEMNIKKVINKLNIIAEVAHADLASVTEQDADIFIMAKDIATSSSIPANKLIIINNLINIGELEEKIKDYFKDNNEIK